MNLLLAIEVALGPAEAWPFDDQTAWTLTPGGVTGQPIDPLRETETLLSSAAFTRADKS